MIEVDYRELCILSSFHWVPSKQTLTIADSIDPNNKQQVQNLIRQHIVPRIDKLDRTSPRYPNERLCLARIKYNLQYYLTTKKFPLEDVYDAYEPVIDLPEDPLDYYRWAWEVLFPGEDYYLESLDNYKDVSGGAQP